MDWLEESELRKFQVALKADAAAVHATTYPTSVAEAYQRANAHQLGHSRITTDTVVDNHQTIFASDTKSEPSYGKDKDRRKTIPHAEWIKMTPEQQDAIEAQNRQTKKYEFCGKIGHKESQCRSLKNTISELKKENSKKIVAHTTSVPASEDVDEEDSYEAMYVHTTETVLHYQYNPLCEDLVSLCISLEIQKQEQPQYDTCSGRCRRRQSEAGRRCQAGQGSAHRSGFGRWWVRRRFSA